MFLSIQAFVILALLAACSQQRTSAETVVAADTTTEEGSDAAGLPDTDATADVANSPVALRVATFNTSMFRGSAGAAYAATADGRANATHRGDPRHDTADFSDGSVGNLRADYALPSSNLVVRGSGVFWPAPGDPSDQLARVSDHHLVWVDVTLGSGE